MKQWHGNHDVKNSEGVIFALPELYGTEWLMYSRGVDPTGKYHALKLVAKGKCPDKANYWLSWCVDTRRLRDSKCNLTMQEYRPDLHAFVITYLQMLA